MEVAIQTQNCVADFVHTTLKFLILWERSPETSKVLCRFLNTKIFPVTFLLHTDSLILFFTIYPNTSNIKQEAFFSQNHSVPLPLSIPLLSLADKKKSYLLKLTIRSIHPVNLNTYVKPNVQFSLT